MACAALRAGSPVIPNPHEKSRQYVGGFRAQHAGFDNDPGFAQTGEPKPVHAGIGVGTGNDHACNAGLDQRLGAGRSLAMVGAGFQADICRGAPRRRARLGKCLGFGMRPPASGGGGSANNLPAADNDAAYGRIRPGTP
jgi:hypothetical protein